MKTKREKEINRYYRNEDKIERKKERNSQVRWHNEWYSSIKKRERERERERVLFFAKI